MAKVCSSPVSSQLPSTPPSSEHQSATCRDQRHHEQKEIPQDDAEKSYKDNTSPVYKHPSEGRNFSDINPPSSAGRNDNRRHSQTGRRRGGQQQHFGWCARGRGQNRGGANSNQNISKRGRFLFGGSVKDPLNLSSLKPSTGRTPINSPSATPSYDSSGKKPPSLLSVDTGASIMPKHWNPQDPIGLLAEVEGKPSSARAHQNRRRTRTKRTYSKSKGDNNIDATADSNVVEYCSDSECVCRAIMVSDNKRVRLSTESLPSGSIDLIGDHRSPSPPRKRARTQSTLAAISLSPVKRKSGSRELLSPQQASTSGFSDKKKASAEKLTTTDASAAQAGPSSSAPNVSMDKKADTNKPQTQPNQRPKDRFRYGNYDRYYGKRLTSGDQNDERLIYFKSEWFHQKSVLDIGCNAGFISLHIAREYKPSKLVGLDIDQNLINQARNSLRRAMPQRAPANKYPPSFGALYGPLAPPPVGGPSGEYPFNVTFMQGNYVLPNDQALATVRPEYDVILALSITKWIHLNWGDQGLKRFFKRAYSNLKPNGYFILEPQPFKSYSKRKQLAPEIRENFAKIQFRPCHFTDYLMNEVGFTSCHMIGTPDNTAAGFRRPLQMFVKGSKNSVPSQMPSTSTETKEDVKME